MADLIAEQIMGAVITKLTGLTTTSTRVYRSRALPAESANLPGLFISQGSDNPQSATDSDNVYNKTDSVLSVSVVAAIQSLTENVETTLNQIRKEVWIALMADETLGLAAVWRVEPVSFADIQVDQAGEYFRGQQSHQWAIYYRSSRTDPSQ